MCDFGTGNNNKLNWVLEDKQELIDIIETIYRGAKKGRGLVVSPKGMLNLCLGDEEMLTFSQITLLDTAIRSHLCYGRRLMQRIMIRWGWSWDCFSEWDIMR